jgi:PAS domain S-box-containing protein
MPEEARTAPSVPAADERREALLRARLRLLDCAVGRSTRELLQATLDEVGVVTDSPIGFYHFVSADERALTLQAWSTRTVQEFCTAEGYGRHYDMEQAGVWVDCIRQRRPVIHNDYASLPHKKGMPPGHAAVIRELAVPIFRGGRIVAVLGVGNKPADYTDEDVRLVAEFADFAWDIAERKKAEESLRESELRLRLALYASRQGLFDRDLKTGIETVTDEYLAMLGFTPGQPRPLRLPWSERLPQDDRQAAAGSFTAYLAGDVPEYRVESRHRTPDGGWKWVLSLGSVVEWTPDGRPSRMLGTYTDVDERRRTEEALERRILALTQPPAAVETLRLSDLFNLDDLQRIQDTFASATGVASIITEPDGTPITRPSRFCRLCIGVIRNTNKGRANCLHSDAVIGRHNEAGPVIQPCLSGGLWDAGASITVGGRHVANWLIGQVKNADLDEAAMRRYAEEIGADPAEFDAALAEVPVMSPERFTAIADAVFALAQELSAKAYQNVQQARFIADRRQADEERTRLETQLQQARKLEAVGRLAGGVAHDLNNMLAPVLGYGELLAQELEGEDSRSMVLEILSAAGRARDLVRQLLAFGRRQMIDLKPVDLNQVVTGLEGILRRTIRENVSIVLALDEAACTVKADRVQIEQVLLNLAVNAQDAMPDGGTLTLSTGHADVTEEDLRRDPGGACGPHVVLRVRDTGVGISPDLLDRIFDPFFTTKEMGKGTGLGLATVYGIVKQHRGMVDVSSHRGGGTTFQILLPAAAPSSDTSSIPPEPAAAGGTDTILVVEDQAQVREMVCQALARHGYAVLGAENGETALRVAAAHRGDIDLLLTDVIMTSMNGRQLRDQLAQARPGLRTIYMSGYPDDIIGREGVLDGDADFIQKPFSLGALTTLIRRVLDRSASKIVG